MSLKCCHDTHISEPILTPALYVGRCPGALLREPKPLMTGIPIVLRSRFSECSVRRMMSVALDTIVVYCVSIMLGEEKDSLFF